MSTQNDEFLAPLCNNFNIAKNDADEVIIEFNFSEPKKSPQDDTPVRLIKRIAMSSKGAERFCQLLRITLSGKGNPPREGGGGKRI